MKLEVLISCMHQKDASIIQRTNIQSDVLVINQCDENKVEEFDFKNKKGENCHARIIYTQERGLSKSRNMAIRNAKGDICLLCDDDELFEDDYVQTIIRAFEENPKTAVITFLVLLPNKNKYASKEKNIGYIGAMRAHSVEIAFRRKSILDKGICFDELMGSGTGNGGGEEIKFLFDCLSNGLKIRYCPTKIASVAQTDSKWFDGFTNKYFLNRGWSNRRILGLPLACCYALYFSVKNHPKYRLDNTFWNALYYQLKGTFKQLRRNA